VVQFRSEARSIEGQDAGDGKRIKCPLWTLKEMLERAAEGLRHLLTDSHGHALTKIHMPYSRLAILSATLSNVNRRIAQERNRLLRPLEDSELLPIAALIRALRTECEETISKLEEYIF